VAAGDAPESTRARNRFPVFQRKNSIGAHVRAFPASGAQFNINADGTRDFGSGSWYCHDIFFLEVDSKVKKMMNMRIREYANEMKNVA